MSVIKLFKRAISLFVLAVFVLSLVPVVGMAEALPEPTITLPSYKTTAAAMPWTGDNVPSSNMIGFNSTGGVVGINGSLVSSNSSKTTHHVEMQYSYGTFGKLPDDAVYIARDRDTRTTADLTQFGSFYGLSFDLPDGVDKRTCDFAVDFSFAFTDANDKITALTPMYVDYSKATDGGTSGANIGYKISITPTSATLISSTKAFAKPIELNTWHNATMVFDVCADSTGTVNPGSYTYKLFIDSELYASHTFNSSSTFYGPRYIRLGLDNVGNSKAAVPDNWTQFDNINCFAIPNDGAVDYVPTKSTASTLTSSDSNIEFIDNTINAPKEYTVADLKKSLTSSKTDDVIRYYNSDYSALKSDADPAINTNIVIASLQDGVETTFSYYAVEKWVKKFPGINSGTTVLSTRDPVSSQQSMEVVTGNLGGKDNESYLMWCDSDGTTQRVIPISGASEEGKRDVLEMSVYIPADSEGFYTSQFLSNTAGTGATGFSFYFKNDGIYIKWSNALNLLCALEPDKWHTIAIVTPKPYSDGSDPAEGIVEIYVDGTKYTEGTNYTYTGFRYIRLTCFGNGSLTPAVYFDNIRVYNGEYEPQYDTLAEISYKDGIDADNNITVKGATTVAQLKEGITKDEETNIRVYSSLTSATELEDSAYVQSGNVVVAADKNGSEMERSYNYYTIDRIKTDIEVSTLVNGAVAKLYDSDDTLSVSADFTNYTDSDTCNVTMYTAQYKYGELVNLWQDDATVTAGQTATLTCDFAGMTDRENSSIKVILVDENLNPYAEAAQMRYNSADTQATLYLLGDSIVQTYVNPGYPIQGWGYYIGDYLNDNITVENRATSGWTTDHYLYPEERNLSASNPNIWVNVLPKINAGDYVMVSLGINDSGSGNVPEDRYLENITTIYNQATAKGATVIFSTPTISGRAWNSTGFSASWSGRGKICEEFAAKNSSVCIPLGAALMDVYNDMVTDYLAENPGSSTTEAYNYVRNYFHMYPESGGTPPVGWSDFGTKTADDSTHHNEVGSNKVASVIAQLLLESGSSLGDYVVISQ